MPVKPIPEGYPTVSPYLVVEDVSRLINFLKEVFNAEELERLPGPQGGIMHAEVRIGDSVVMMGQSGENNPALQCMLYLYLEDTDATYEQALFSGAVSLQEPTDTFYGDRTAGVQDAFGNQWWMATRIEEVPRDEMIRRAAAQTRES